MNIFKKKSGSITLIVGITILVVITIIGCGGKKSKKKSKSSPAKDTTSQAVKLVKVQLPSSTETRSVPGKTLAVTETELSFRVSGQIEELPVKIGQKVKKGATIARVSSNKYKFGLDEAKADLKSAQARLINVKRRYQRDQELWANEDIDADTLDASRAAYESLKDKVDELKARVLETKNRLGYTTLKAPFTGEIVDKHVDKFDLVKIGEPIVDLIDSTSFEVKAYLPEKLFLKKKQFKKFRCLFSEYPDKFYEAKLKGIGHKALSPTLTYPLVVTLVPEKDLQIYPGMEVEVLITIDRRKEKKVFKLPSSAVVSGSGKQKLVWVYNKKSGTVSKRPIVVGQLRSSGIEITKGLEGGELVVAAGGNYLHQGQKVQPVSKKFK